MGNECNFELHLARSTNLGQAVDTLFDCAAKLGCFATAALPERGGFSIVFSQNEEYRCTSLPELKQVLVEHGGCSYVFKDDEYPSISCVPADGRIGFSSGTTLSENASHYETDLRLLFLLLAERLRPIYAYSADEWGFEYWLVKLGGWDAGFENFKSSVKRREAPPILWWLNYFSQPYYANVEGRLEGLSDAGIVRCGDGVLVQLSDHAWESDVALLGSDGMYHPAT